VGGSGFGALLDYMRHWTIRHSSLYVIINVVTYKRT
jgi:hypothetical protein